jgi:hypothetical protein
VSNFLTDVLVADKYISSISINNFLGVTTHLIKQVTIVLLSFLLLLLVLLDHQGVL